MNEQRFESITYFYLIKSHPLISSLILTPELQFYLKNISQIPIEINNETRNEKSDISTIFFEYKITTK